MTDSSWVAFHVFYAGDDDRLLLEGIRPVLHRLRSDGLMDRYFFVRYWNGGPHIRVRIRPLVPGAAVEEKVEESIRSFLRRYPAGPSDQDRYVVEAARIQELEERLGGQAGSAAEAFEPLCPTDSVERRPYVFDARRYGGLDNMEDAHDHAWASTEIALSVVELTRERLDLRRTFALHAAAIASTLLEADALQAADYFEEASRWDGSPRQLSGDEDPGLRDVRLLMERQELAWPGFWKLLLASWGSELDRRQRSLAAARRANKLDVPPDYLILDAMHMFSNRLGISLNVECYIYSLISSMMRERLVVGGKRT